MLMLSNIKYYKDRCEILNLAVMFPLQLTSQDHTPQVIQRAIEKHNMEDVSCHDFSLYQMLNSGKGEYSPQAPSGSLIFSE